jgi:hypothetical protein
MEERKKFGIANGAGVVFETPPSVKDGPFLMQ